MAFDWAIQNLRRANSGQNPLAAIPALNVQQPLSYEPQTVGPVAMPETLSIQQLLAQLGGIGAPQQYTPQQYGAQQYTPQGITAPDPVQTPTWEDVLAARGDYGQVQQVGNTSFAEILQMLGAPPDVVGFDPKVDVGSIDSNALMQAALEFAGTPVDFPDPQASYDKLSSLNTERMNRLRSESDALLGRAQGVSGGLADAVRGAVQGAGALPGADLSGLLGALGGAGAGRLQLQAASQMLGFTNEAEQQLFDAASRLWNQDFAARSDYASKMPAYRNQALETLSSNERTNLDNQTRAALETAANQRYLAEATNSANRLAFDKRAGLVDTSIKETGTNDRFNASAINDALKQDNSSRTTLLNQLLSELGQNNRQNQKQAYDVSAFNAGASNDAMKANAAALNEAAKTNSSALNEAMRTLANAGNDFTKTQYQQAGELVKTAYQEYMQTGRLSAQTEAQLAQFNAGAQNTQMNAFVNDANAQSLEILNGNQTLRNTMLSSLLSEGRNAKQAEATAAQHLVDSQLRVAEAYIKAGLKPDGTGAAKGKVTQVAATVAALESALPTLVVTDPVKLQTQLVKGDISGLDNSTVVNTLASASFLSTGRIDKANAIDLISRYAAQKATDEVKASGQYNDIKSAAKAPAAIAERQGKIEKGLLAQYDLLTGGDNVDSTGRAIIDNLWTQWGEQNTSNVLAAKTNAFVKGQQAALAPERRKAETDAAWAAYLKTPEFAAAEAKWKAGGPMPTLPPEYIKRIPPPAYTPSPIKPITLDTSAVGAANGLPDPMSAGINIDVLASLMGLDPAKMRAALNPAAAPEGDSARGGMSVSFGADPFPVTAGGSNAPVSQADVLALLGMDINKYNIQAPTAGTSFTQSSGNATVDRIINTITGHESGGQNIRTNLVGADGTRASAQGLFQYTTPTWQAQAKLAGVSVAKYPTAMSAPPEVQTQVAANNIQQILKDHGGQVEAVPAVWYLGHYPKANEWDQVPHPEAGNKQTVRQYVNAWMQKYNKTPMSTSIAPTTSTSASRPAPAEAVNFLKTRVTDKSKDVNFNPPLATGLAAMLKERPGIKIMSGVRTRERQQQIWDERKRSHPGEPDSVTRKWVALPGNSKHEKRDAADLSYASQADIEWAHANAKRFGLHFPLGNENWHIEAIGSRG